MRAHLVLTVGFSLSLPLLAGAQQQPTRAVADRYLTLTMNQEYDALLDAYRDDARFFDPTAEVFEGPIAEGPIEGARKIVELQQSWGLAASEFDVAAAFSVGRYALYRGTLRVRHDVADAWIAMPFVTVLRIDAGQVAERTDFGGYVEPFGMEDRFGSVTEETRRISAEYLKAYLGADLEAQRRLLAPDAVFQDPTAQVYGPGSGQRLVGAGDIMERRTQTFQNVAAFDLAVSDSFVSGHHAVYMGRTTYTLRNGTRFDQPAVMVIEVRGGQVTRHWDFVDYSVAPVGA